VIDVGKEVPVPRGAIKLTKNTLKFLLSKFGLEIKMFLCIFVMREPLST